MGCLSFLNVFSSLVTLSYGEAGALGATAGPWYEKKNIYIPGYFPYLLLKYNVREGT